MKKMLSPPSEADTTGLSYLREVKAVPGTTSHITIKASSSPVRTP